MPGVEREYQPDVEIERERIAPPFTLQSLKRTLADFGFRLMEKCHEPGTATTMSPLSVGVAMMMVLDGASGQTRYEIAQALGLKPAQIEEMHSAAKELMASLKGSRDGIELSSANAMWAGTDFNLSPAYILEMCEYFGADVRNMPANQQQAVAQINDWVKEQTRGKIDSIVDGVDTALELDILNAVYFKGKWEAEFDPSATKDAFFRNSDGTMSDIRMMSLKTDMPYGTLADGTQVARLLYRDPASEDNTSMFVILPPEGGNASDCVRQILSIGWDSLYSAHLHMQEVQLYLPRLSLSADLKLNDPLKALGIERAFDSGRADFDNMVLDGRATWIDKVQHKAKIDIDEEGTEAAAVTVVAVKRMAAMLAPPVMQVDRPFAFVIEKGGLPLFTGAVDKV